MASHNEDTPPALLAETATVTGIGTGMRTGENEDDTTMDKDLGTERTVQAMTDEIAAAEQAVSQAFWSTLSVVSDGFATMTTTTSNNTSNSAMSSSSSSPDPHTNSRNRNNNNSNTKDDNDADLDAFFHDDDLEDTTTAKTTIGEVKEQQPELGGTPAEAREEPTPITTTTVASSWWSTLSSVADTVATVGVTATTTPEAATATATAAVAAGITTRPPEETTTMPGGNLVVDAAASLYSLYTTNYNQAAGWIEDLEQQHTNEDPHQHIRENLDRYLLQVQGQEQRHSPSKSSTSGGGNTGTTTTRDGSGGSYEEWILQGFEGWDEEDDEEDDDNKEQDQQQQHYKEIPAQYYAEECIHRSIWNERVHLDGIRIEDTHPSRSYVPAPSTGKDRRHPATYSVPEEETEATPDNDEEDEEVVFVTAPEHDEDERPAGSLTTDTRLFGEALEAPSRQQRMEETGNNRGGEGPGLTTTTTTGTATITGTNHDVTAAVSTLPDDSDLDILLLDDDTSNEDVDVA